MGRRCLPLQEVVLKAFRTLANPDKRDRAMETYVQARDKVEYSWKKRNKAAKKDGQAETPFILNEAEVQEGDGKQVPNARSIELSSSIRIALLTGNVVSSGEKP